MASDGKAQFRNPQQSISARSGLRTHAAWQIIKPAVMRKVYLENFRADQTRLAGASRAMGIEFYTFVTERKLIESITRFLHRRARGG